MHKLFLLLLAVFASITLHAQQMETFSRLKEGGYNYWFYTPDTLQSVRADSLAVVAETFADDSVASQKKPLVVFLHGQSLCGGHINNVLRYGTLDALRRGRNIDAYVVAPHNPGGRWDPVKVLDLVDWAIQNYPVDSCRVYVLGMSLGGFGTINVAAAYPERFAAAMALCGGGNNPNYANLTKIPLWILHGTADRDVKIRDSDEVVAGMRNVCKPERLIYNRLRGKNHSILARIFYMPQTYDWLFAHSLSDSARTICQDYSIVDADFGTAYNDLHSPTWQSIRLVNHLSASSQPASGEIYGSAVHKVRKGDTLSGIARRYHTTVRRLCRLNGIKETSTLRLGQKIRVR